MNSEKTTERGSAKAHKWKKSKAQAQVVNTWSNLNKFQKW